MRKIRFSPYDVKIHIRIIFVFVIVMVLQEARMFYSSYSFTDVIKNVDQIYSINFTGTENLIEADRDAYQSVLALNQAILFPVIAVKEREAGLMEVASWINTQVLKGYRKFDRF